MEAKVRLGISTCLLGENVRYDGGHKRDRFIIETLGQFVEFVPVCPEVECGLTIPRESMHLAGDPDSPRLVTTRTKIDHTERMVNWARKRVRELEKENLCGFIFKSNSPSSGMERVKIYDEHGRVQKIGVGMFARAFMDYFPLLPAEEDGRLHDIRLRENFIERIFALKRWRELLDSNKTRGNLVAFHTQHKLLIMSHSQKHLRFLGKLVAEAKKIPAEQLYSQYQMFFMEALRLKTTIKKNINVLQHMMGYFKKQLSADEKRELLETIDHYRNEYIPLIVPVTLIMHYVRKYDQTYLKEQLYLNPHPIELKLRNHA